MDRRLFLKSAGAAGLAATLPAAGATNKPASKKEHMPPKGRSLRQAVILITDVTRKDMLNCYALSGLQTPNLDRLATEGIRFGRAYTTQPLSAPAGAAIFTGLYPHTNGCWGNDMPLGSTVRSLGQYLSDAGVHCGYMGKWYLDGSGYSTTGKPAAGGDSDVWYDQHDYLKELTPEERRHAHDASISRDAELPVSVTFVHRCSSRAIDFIQKHKDKDFLLVVSYDEPNDLSIAPKKYRNLYVEYGFPYSPNEEDTLENKPEEQKIWAGDSLNKPFHPVRKPDYFGALSFVDSEIGRVLDQLDQSTPDALVMYTASHGSMLSSHHLQGEGPAMYEEITNVPLLVRWRGVTPKNVESNVPVSHIDLSGTMLEYFGHDAPREFEGGSMLASFKNPNHASRDHIFMEWGCYAVDHDGSGGLQPIRCICDGRYKLSVHLLTSDELYDLKTDPHEINNLIDAKDHAALRNAMHDKLLAWMETTHDPFRSYYWGRRAWRPDYPVTWKSGGMTQQRPGRHTA